jgi:nucleoside-diphosphate-sugar epimerase
MLAGPRSTLAGALKKAAALAGTKGPVVIPNAVIKVMTAIMSVLSKVLPVPALYQPETLKAGLATYLGTGERARRELGWEPRPLDEGLAGTVEYLRRG